VSDFCLRAQVHDMSWFGMTLAGPPNGFASRTLSVFNPETLDLDEVNELFKTYDKDGSGYLDLKELAAFLKDMYKGREPEPEEVTDAFRCFDVNGDGKVSWTEFREAMMSAQDRGFKPRKTRQYKSAKIFREDMRKHRRKETNPDQEATEPLTTSQMVGWVSKKVDVIPLQKHLNKPRKACDEVKYSEAVIMQGLL